MAKVYLSHFIHMLGEVLDYVILVRPRRIASVRHYEIAFILVAHGEFTAHDCGILSLLQHLLIGNVG